jgi:hypothetical protein
LTGSSSLCPNPIKVNLNLTAVGPITTGYVAEAPVPGSILCQSSTVPCPSSYPTGTPLSAKLSSSQATLAAGFSTIKCNESLASMQVTAAGGVFEAATTKLTSLAFGSCNAAVSVLSSGSASIRTIPGTADGNLIESGTEIEVQLGTTKCFYGGEVSSGLVLEAGAPATLTAINAPLTREPGSSLLCAPQAKFGAKYTFTGLNTSLYVADH